MDTYILDTNFIYSLIDQSDSNYESAYRTIFSTKGYTLKILIPYIAAVEAIVSTEKFDVLSFLKLLSGNKLLMNSIQDLEFVNTLPKTMARSLKANDCLILALCKRYDAELLTFDKKLQKAYNYIIAN